MPKKYDVFGISDVIIRVITELTDEELAKLSLTKGTRSVIDLERRNELLNSISETLGDRKPTVSIDGYTITAMRAMSYLGLKTAVTGKIGLDSFGIDIKQHLSSVNMDLDLKMGYGCTDSKMFFKTPDDIITRNYHLGMSKNMTFQEIDSVKIKDAKHLLITGDLLDNAGRIRLAQFVTRVANESGTKVVFDINNVRNIVKDRSIFFKIMDTADIIIISLDEAYMLFETNDPATILSKLGEFAPVVAMKQKDKYYIHDHGNQFCVSKMDGPSRFADEFFTAGFIFGCNQEYGIDKAAIIGSYIASKKEISSTILEELHQIL